MDIWDLGARSTMPRHTGDAAVTCTQKLGMLWRSRPGIQAVAYRESHDNSVKILSAAGHTNIWESWPIPGGIVVSSTSNPVALLSTETPACRARPAGGLPPYSHSGILPEGLSGTRSILWVHDKGTTTGAASTSHLTPDLLCYSRPFPTSQRL